MVNVTIYSIHGSYGYKKPMIPGFGRTARSLCLALRREISGPMESWCAKISGPTTVESWGWRWCPPGPPKDAGANGDALSPMDRSWAVEFMGDLISRSSHWRIRGPIPIYSIARIYPKHLHFIPSKLRAISFDNSYMPIFYCLSWLLMVFQFIVRIVGDITIVGSKISVYHLLTD